MRHFSTRALARYSAGAFGMRKAARVTAHLARCQRCSALIAHLNSLSRMLASVSPTRMPNHLADRLSQAIAAESASRAARMSAAAGAAPTAPTETEVGEPDRPMPGMPDLPARRRRVLSSPVVQRGLALAAGVAIVAGAGYLFASRSPTASPGGTAAPTSHRAVSGQAAGSHKSAVNIPYGSGHVSAQNSQRAPFTVPVLTSGTDYTKANLDAQVRESVRSTATGRESFATNFATPRPTASENGSRRLLDGLTEGQLTECLTGIAHGRRVLVADVARYLGKPATIIVLASLNSVNVLDVIIVGLACSASDAHVIAMTTVPRR
jgi:hypothetical protein